MTLETDAEYKARKARGGRPPSQKETDSRRDRFAVPGEWIDDGGNVLAPFRARAAALYTKRRLLRGYERACEDEMQQRAAARIDREGTRD